MAVHPHVHARRAIDPARRQFGNRISLDLVQHDFERQNQWVHVLLIRLSDWSKAEKTVRHVGVAL